MPKSKKPKAVVHLAENGEKAANSAPSAIADAREAKNGDWPCSRPGQAVYNGLFDDKLEAEILEHIANGCTWTDSARLCGISRDSSLNWRNRGAAYLANPDEHPQDARYGLFVQRIEEAEMRCKAGVIRKILQSDDWRAWRFWMVNRTGGEWKSEHTTTEISGPDGGAIPMANAFVVNVSIGGDPNEKFTIIDHGGHRESQTLEDPFAEPKTRELPDPGPRKSRDLRR